VNPSSSFSMKKEEIKNIPENPGVYIFKNVKGEVIYVGKAANLRRRASSYFSGRNIKDSRIAEEARDIEYEETETVIEALIREAELIKKYRPSYNIKENDDRSFLHVVITDENYPRVLLTRGKDLENYKKRSVFGPFVYSSEIRNALKIIRRIFPYSTHTEKEIGKGRGCFYHQINLCPGVCAGKMSRSEYLKNIRNIELFLKGKRKEIISRLTKRMKEASKKMEYEKAEEFKRKIDALSYIQETALLSKKEKGDGVLRIEGYDVSNISGDLSVGSMVVFKGGEPSKSDYRLFNIRSVRGPNDIDMIKEILRRRVENNWPLPSVIVVDGGEGQVNGTKEVLGEKGLDIPVVGIAKGVDRKGERMVGDSVKVEKDILIKVQREAHRFALSHHRRTRKKNFL